MKCNDVQDLLLEYRDGELDQELAAGLQMHFGNCGDCSALLKALEAEGRVYKKFRESIERDLDVNGEMWARVKKGIAGGTDASPVSHRVVSDAAESAGASIRSRWFGLLRQAAFAAALVVLTVAGTLVAVRHFGLVDSRPISSTAERSQPIVAENSQRPNGGEKTLEGAMRAIRRAEQDYIDAIQILSDIVDKRKPTLDPRLALELERNLKAIDESIEATRKACYAHPTDPYLAQTMLTSYSKKVELLQEIAS